MEKLLETIAHHRKEISGYAPNGDADAESFRIKFLGTKGLVKALMNEMKNVSSEKKRETGQVLNEFKLFVENK